MRLLISIVSLLFAFCADAAITAEQVLDKTISRISSAPSVSINMSINGNNEHVKGTMILCKDRFSFSAGDISVWFNGKTQWVLQHSAKEVTISEPNVEELIESNPFALLSNYKKMFTCRLVKSDKSSYVILLTARTRHSAYKSAIVTINRNTFYPTSVEGTMSNGAKTTVRITSLTKGKSLAPSAFQYNPKQHKGISVNDLR